MCAVLGDGQTVLDATTRSFISSLRPREIRVTGGAGAIPDQMYTALSQLAATTKRLDGADRYATSVSVNKAEYPSARTQAVLVTGADFPDALYGGPYAGERDFPMYLSQTGCVPQNVLDDMRRLGVTNVTLIGGAAVLTNDVASLTSCAAGSTSGALPAAAQQFADYQAANPDNLAGQDQLAMSLFKTHVLVRFEGAADFITGTQAQAALDADKAAMAAVSPRSASIVTPASPSMFKVWVVKVNTLCGWEFGGHWEFDKTFAGQTSPDDVATFEFDVEKCAKLSKPLEERSDLHDSRLHERIHQPGPLGNGSRLAHR